MKKNTIDIDIKTVLIETIALLFLYNLFRILFHHTINHLDTSIYFSTSFFLSSFKNSTFLIFFGTVSAYLIYNHSKTSWSQFSDYKLLRIFLYAVTFPIFWEQFFYDYNFYLNTDALIDKSLLLAFMLLIFIHPLFSFMVLFVGYIFFLSISFPFDSIGAHLPEFTAIYHILMLFISFILLKSTNKFKNIDTKLFIFLALTIHASNYFIPGIAKIEISPNGWEWAFSDEINNLFVSAYVSGWFGFLKQETVLWIVNYLNHIDIVFTISNMFIQLGAIFLLYRKNISLFMFILFELFHIGILLMSGIFFWQWIILNLGFIYTIKHLSKENLDFLYNKKMFVIFVSIVLLSPLIYRPFVFAWWDSNLNTVYDIYAVNEKNETIKLNSQDLSPYDEIFAQNAKLSFIDSEKTLVNNRGILLKDTNLYSSSYILLRNYIDSNSKHQNKSHFYNKSFIIYDALERANTIDEVKSVLEEYGVCNYSEEKKKVFTNFLQTYFKNYNKKREKASLCKKLGAPYMLYDFSPSGLEKNPQIEHLEIYKKNIWYDKRAGKIKTFSYKKIMEIPIN